MLGDLLNHVMSHLQFDSNVGNIRFESIYYLLNKVKPSGVVFYPSSGKDISDLHYVNEKKIPYLENLNPNIFIHCDYLNQRRFFYTNRISPSYVQLESYFFEDKFRSIEVNRYKRVNLNTEFWLILFNGICNEDVIKGIIASNVKLDVVYSPIDGITSGMGCFECKSIPTMFYPIFKKLLGFRFLITDQIISNYKEFKNIQSSKIFRAIDSINQILSEKEIEDNDIENMINSMQAISLAESNKLGIYHHVLGNRLFLYKM